MSEYIPPAERKQREQAESATRAEEERRAQTQATMVISQLVTQLQQRGCPASIYVEKYKELTKKREVRRWPKDRIFTDNWSMKKYGVTAVVRGWIIPAGIISIAPESGNGYPVDAVITEEALVADTASRPVKDNVLTLHELAFKSMDVAVEESLRPVTSLRGGTAWRWDVFERVLRDKLG